ncbi:hypothetical protein [Oceanivirga salmonicida]|uniref:hypothetical protein n=1 Tax=Oceanivirga salmonicida TaxID=1769291 RepID=UPI00082D141A|nr:hypothetical protein [Oceanivirga salmonicida]
MNELLRNALIQLIIPIALIIYYRSYKKAATDKVIPPKGGFRTIYSKKNIKNWNEMNLLAARVTYVVIIIDIIACLISLTLQILKYVNSTKLYVVTVAYMLITHFVSVMYIQYRKK